MSDRLKGKRAFVTAAAVGIGRACAVAFAREGATVFATDIDEAKLAALKGEGIAEVARLDVRDTTAVAAMARRAGQTDILLNAAGFVHHGTIMECSEEDWDFSFDLNTGDANILITSDELKKRRAELKAKGGFPYPANQTPWQELYRSTVGQQATGACMELATRYQNIAGTVGVARDNH